MIKKKLSDLVSNRGLSSNSKFEVLSDVAASNLLGGGPDDCGKLQECGTFSGGSCPDLGLCGKYTNP